MNKNTPKPQLPPLPKLRPRPGFQFKEPVTPNYVHKEKDSSIQEGTDSNKLGEESSTSRLLMKSECKGAGRKRSSGSLIHSIPKFSQVKPNGRLTEVQKVLQSRIIMKQQRQIQEKQRISEEVSNNRVDHNGTNNKTSKAGKTHEQVQSVESSPSSHQVSTKRRGRNRRKMKSAMWYQKINTNQQSNKLQQ